MASPSTPTSSQPHIFRLLPQLASQSHQTLTHLSRLLSTTAHLDTFLLTTSYTLHLLHALLSRPHPTSQLRLTKSLSPLAGLLDDYRTLLRLFGLLSIYQLAAKTYMTKDENASSGERVLRWAQIASLAVFQACENATVLASGGVLDWGRGRIGRVSKWSVRAWMAYVGLEFVRLWNEWRQINRREREVGTIDGGEKSKGVIVKGSTEGEMLLEKRGAEQEVVSEEKRREWWRRVGVNAAYAPMTVHYSVDGEGPLGEGSIGLLGVVVAWLSFGKAWRECA